MHKDHANVHALRRTERVNRLYDAEYSYTREKLRKENWKVN